MARFWDEAAETMARADIEARQLVELRAAVGRALGTPFYRPRLEGVGIALASLRGHKLRTVLTLLGNLVGIFSGVCFAGVAILLRKQKDGSAVESIILGNLLAFVIGLPFIATAPALPGSGWVLLVLLGVVQLGLSYKLYSQAIRHVTALEAVLIPVVEPIFNPVWVLLFVGERPGPLALAGGVIVLGAVTRRAVASLRPARQP